MALDHANLRAMTGERPERLELFSLSAPGAFGFPL